MRYPYVVCTEAGEELETVMAESPELAALVWLKYAFENVNLGDTHTLLVKSDHEGNVKLDAKVELRPVWILSAGELVP